MIETKVSQGIISTYFEKMQKNLNLDVAIVGGGPSGIVAAYYLAKAGLKVGDVVIALNGQAINSANDLPVKISAMKPGTKAKLTVLRNGKEKEVTVTVAENPEDSVTPNEAKQTQGKLGVSVRELNDQELKELDLTNGLLVTEVRAAAARAGLMPRDIILSANGKNVKTVGDLRRAVSGAEKVALLVQRQQSRIFIAVDLK